MEIATIKQEDWNLKKQDFNIRGVMVAAAAEVARSRAPALCATVSLLQIS